MPPQPKLTKTRNIGIIAHIDAGKTTVTERVLFYSGRVHKMGEVHNGEATMDWMLEEKERGITITSAVTSCNWLGHTINIIDTPGHADFGGEVERSLNLVDGAILLVDSSEGPLPQTRYVLSNALENGLSPIVVINKIDRSDARISAVVDEVFVLFLDVDASEYECDFPLIYTNSRTGTATLDLEIPGRGLRPEVMHSCPRRLSMLWPVFPGHRLPWQ